MDTIEVIKSQMNVVPTEFWYSATIILIAVLVWIVQKYFSSLQTTLGELRESISELKTIVHDLSAIVKVHEREISSHDEDIKDLRGRLTQGKRTR